MPPVEEANALDLPSYIDRYLPDCQEGAKIAFGATNGENSHKWTISVADPLYMSRRDLDACFRLIETTSKADYVASSMGWHPRQKKREMQLPDMRYLLVHSPSASGELGAFTSFMMTYEDGAAVVYVYEIHVARALRGQGVGKRLMQLVETAGRTAGMQKAMLTAFRANAAATTFYKARGYDVDAFSPEPRNLRGGVSKEPDYTILSMPLR